MSRYFQIARPFWKQHVIKKQMKTYKTLLNKIL